ncbi:MAG TPA: cytochrome c-type biogenesis protein [Usitatibacter sp.]
MKLLLAAAALAFASLAFGQAEEVARPNPAIEGRLKALAEELRCLVCQNQTIADSNAPLALDLRNQIRGQIAAGRSDDEIRAYMVDRYGDFVLYRPPFKGSTAILWIGPFALLALAIWIAATIARRRKRAVAAPLAGAPARDEVAALLDAESRDGRS